MNATNLVRFRVSRRTIVLCASLGILVTIAVTWLFAHEGHAPLPTKGAQVDVEKGRIVLAAAARSALDVQVGTVEIRPFDEKVLGYVTLVAPWQKHAFATSQLSGRIVRMHARPGQPVKAGEVLAEVQSPQLETLRLEIVAAQTNVELSKKTLEALKLNPASVSGQALAEAETKYQQYINALEVARAKWASLGLALGDLENVARDTKLSGPLALPIRSPLDGQVIHADLSVGRVIEPWEHLFEIVNLKKVWVRVDVLEKDIHKVAVGQNVDVYLVAHAGESFHVTVQVQSLTLDPVTHLVSFWGELENADEATPRCLPGMKGQAHIHTGQNKQAKIIPTAALIEDGLDHYVLVEEANSAKASEYQKRSVTVVRRDESWVEIQTADIFQGDRVVTRGAHELGAFFFPTVLRLSPQSVRTIGLKVEPVSKQVVQDVLEMDGSVETPPDRRAFASPQIAGALERIHVDRGQTVTKGQLLGEMASLEFQNLQLDLLKEHLEYQLLEKQHQALKPLDAVVSKLRLLEVESNLAASRNRKETFWSRLSILGLSNDQLDDLVVRKKLTELLPIRAPVTGTLVHFDKVLGQTVKADEKLFTVHDLEKPLIECFVSERDLPRIRFDKPQFVRVRFSADPGRVYTGKVLRSSGVFGAESRTVSAWVELDEYPKTPLLHKQLARLSIAVNQPAATIAVPLSAIVHEGTSAFVFIQKDDGSFDRQEVRTGRSDDQHVEILQGLQLGQMVAVRGTSDLQTAHASLR